MYKYLTDDQLNQIENRLMATTPEPWQSFVEGRDHTSGSNFIMTGGKLNRGSDIELIGASSEDQDFIAAARSDIPLLIKEIKYLKHFINTNL